MEKRSQREGASFRVSQHVTIAIWGQIILCPVHVRSLAATLASSF